MHLVLRCLGECCLIVCVALLAAVAVASCGGGAPPGLPTATPDATWTPAASPTAEPTTVPVSLHIEAPAEGDYVSMLTYVRFRAEPLELQGLNAYILVKPIPNDPNQDWWVQALPTVAGEGVWESVPVYLGLETDPPGLPFRICAVATSDILRRGQNLSELPAGSSTCIDVARQ